MFEQMMCQIDPFGIIQFIGEGPSIGLVAIITIVT